MTLVFNKFANSQIAFINSLKDISQQNNYLYLKNKNIDLKSINFHDNKANEETIIVIPGINWLVNIHKLIDTKFRKFAILPTLNLESSKRTCIVSYENKVIFLPNYKVMYSSFREYMRSNFSEFFNAPKVSHGLNSNIDLNDPQYNDFFKFSIVRNPFDRYASFYRDKLARNKDHYNYKWWNYPIRSILGKDEITIYESLDFISKIPDSHSDPHFLSQQSKLYHNEKPLVDYIGKIENLNTSLEYISRKANISPINIPVYNKTNKTKSVTEDFMSFYQSNSKTIEIIKKRYRSDFQIFNYK